MIRIMGMTQLKVVTQIWFKHKMELFLLISLILFFMDLLIGNIYSLGNENTVRAVNNFVH